jgi:hypothetical protein
MKILELVRLEETKQGTLGILKIDKQLFCCTLEPPDRLNERNRSNIDPQQYICTPYASSRHGETWKVDNVPGRSGILFHAGNVVDHTEGCILLGDKFGKLNAHRAVLNSGLTFEKFLMLLANDTQVSLTIQEHY